MEEETEELRDIWEETIGKIIRNKIVQASPKRCYTCGSKNKITKHHILPKAFGGLDTVKNFVSLCRNCHDMFHDIQDPKVKLNPTERYLLARLERLKLKKTLDKEFREIQDKNGG